jgi:hypothetical protein
MTDRYPWLAVEPELDDVLDDPVVQAMMARDGVERAEILDLVAAVHERRGQDAGPVTEA